METPSRKVAAIIRGREILVEGPTSRVGSVVESAGSGGAGLGYYGARVGVGGEDPGLNSKWPARQRDPAVHQRNGQEAAVHVTKVNRRITVGNDHPGKAAN